MKEHPNIIRLHEVFEDDKYIILVMDYLGGGDLLRNVLAKGPFSEDDARSCIIKLIEAVQRCHERKILHRDICLENLVLEKPDRADSVKLIDFGSACIFNDKRKIEYNLEADLMSTLEYASPEVCREATYSEASDYWSIGIVAFVLLSGTMPFMADDKVQLMDQIETGDFLMHDEDWEGVSEDARHFVRRVLAKTPEFRLDLE